MDTNESWADRLTRLEVYREEDREVLNEIKKKVDNFHDEMVRYRGFLGAVTFLGSCLAVALSVFSTWFTKYFHSTS